MTANKEKQPERRTTNPIKLLGCSCMLVQLRVPRALAWPGGNRAQQGSWCTPIHTHTAPQVVTWAALLCGKMQMDGMLASPCSRLRGLSHPLQKVSFLYVFAWSPWLVSLRVVCQGVCNVGVEEVAVAWCDDLK